MFNLQLTLKKVDWVFVLGLWDAMNWHSVLFVLKRAHYNIFVEFIDQIVDFCLQGLNALQILVSELVGRAFNELLHVLKVAEIGRGYYPLARLGRGVVFSRDFNCRLPVLSVEVHHELLKVIDFVHVSRLVFEAEVVASFTLQTEVFAHKFIKSLLLED